MGKTHQPLNIWVHWKWWEHPAIETLRVKEHRCFNMEDQYEQPDLILHPSAHWWDDAMFEKPAYLEAALKAARKRRYGEKKKGEKKK